MKKHTVTVNERITARAIEAGMSRDKLPYEMSIRTGISETTLRRRLKDGSWNLYELQLLDAWLQFQPEDFPVFLGRKEQR